MASTSRREIVEVIEVVDAGEPFGRPVSSPIRPTSPWPAMPSTPPASSPSPRAGAPGRRWIGPLVAAVCIGGAVVALGVDGDDRAAPPPSTAVPPASFPQGQLEAIEAERRGLVPVAAVPPVGYHLTFTGTPNLDRAPGVTEVWTLRRTWPADSAWLLIAARQDAGELSATGTSRYDLGDNGVGVLDPQRNGDLQLTFSSGGRWRVVLVAHRWRLADLLEVAAEMTVTPEAVSFGSSSFAAEHTLVERLTGERGADPWADDVQRISTYADDAGTGGRIVLASGPTPRAQRAAIFDALLGNSVRVDFNTQGRIGRPFGNELNVLRFQREGLTITMSGTVSAEELVAMATTVHVAGEAELLAMAGRDAPVAPPEMAPIPVALRTDGSDVVAAVRILGNGDVELLGGTMRLDHRRVVPAADVGDGGLFALATESTTIVFVVATAPVERSLTVTVRFTVAGRSAHLSATPRTQVATVAAGAVGFEALGPWDATLSAPDDSTGATVALLSIGGGADDSA